MLARSAALAAVLMALTPSVGRAQAQDEEANRWLELRFDGAKLHARAWWYGWLGAMAGASGTLATLASLEDKKADTHGLSISATGAGLIVGQLLVFSEPDVFSPQRFAARPTTSPAERRAKREYGCDRLRAAAIRQRKNRGWFAYVSTAAWSLGWGLYLQIRFDDAWVTTRTAGGSILATAGRLLTVPQSARSDWRTALDRGYCRDEDAFDPAVAPPSAITFVPSGLGIAGRW